MDTDKSIRTYFRLKPKHRLILVLLALCGLGLGYSQGFVFKWHTKPTDAKSATYSDPHKEVKTFIPSTTHITLVKHNDNKPILKGLTNTSSLGKQRVNEEALAKDVTNNKTKHTPAKIKTSSPIAAELKPLKRTTSKSRPKSEVLLESTKIFPIPTAGPINARQQKQVPTWKRNAVLIRAGERPRIAVVIDDLGVDIARTRRAMEMRGPLTLSFLAYASDLGPQAEAGRKKGHEIWLHVPMEPGSLDIDPGPNVLLTGLPPKKLLSILRWNLDQLKNYVGINNHMGSRFTAEADSMRIIMGELKRRGLAFLDSVTSPKSSGTKIAREIGVPVTQRNIFLDHNNDLSAINRQLSMVEVLAKRQGRAIAIGHPRETSLKALELWLKTLNTKGFQLVPVSSLLHLSKSTHSIPKGPKDE